MSLTLPLGLRNAIESGNCVLFLGAGIGDDLFKPDGSVAPDGPTLSTELASHFRLDKPDGLTDLAKVAQIVEYRFGRPSLDGFIKKRLADLTPGSDLRWLTTLRWRAIYTTNYDRGMLRAYEMNASPPQQPVSISSTADLVRCDPRIEVPLYFLHGTISSAEAQILITQDDYTKFRDRRRQLFEKLKQDFAESTLLYVGYSHRDSNWRIVLEELQAEFAPRSTPQAYRVVSSSDPLDTEILQRKAVQTIIGSLQEFRAVAEAALTATPSSSDVLETFRNSVPAPLSKAFEKTPTGVIRLLGCWELVNSANFDMAPNTRAFYRGDRANWGLISRKIQVVRDIENRLYDHILDYATSTAKMPSSVVVLGPAGYGSTTVLMDIASRIVIDRAANVFFLREGQVPNEGDIEFAATLDPSIATVFILDSAAKYGSLLRACIQRLRDLSRPALFIFGDRLNTWHEELARPQAVEFVLEPLSDEEIKGLLKCLANVDELGVLSELPPEMQFSAIKQRYQKELLVALREATDGRAFDAIIESEYRGLSTDEARRAYLIVSCFYQAGVYIRDALLADLLALPLSEMYARIAGPTEGVILFDEIDVASGSSGARARHRTIASIVWDRCGSPGERERLITEALSGLNLNYQVDVDAFWQFVQSTDIIDSLRSLDARIQFFETACQKDPTSPYVRQHYARMFRRSKMLPLALREIDEAIGTGSRLKALYHTKGLILTDLAAAESLEIARRRMIQAEDAFTTCISLDRRDDYGYAGLADCYLKWASRTDIRDELSEYVSKAEGAIGDGLKSAREHESLWIASARIEEFLGNDPERVAALEKAIGSVAASRSGRYILGRYYRSRNRPSDAMSILKPVLDNFPDDYRAFLEYSNAMLEAGESYNKAAALLQLSHLTGMRDARYIATLGGMLFMTGDYTGAQKVFDETSARGFSFQESTRAFFHARDPDAAAKVLRLQGEVSAVRAGYAFIDAGDRPSFFFHGTRAGNLILRQRLRVEFDVAFSARGPVALRPTEKFADVVSQGQLFSDSSPTL